MNRLTSLFENDIIDQVSMDFISNESYDSIIDKIDEDYKEKESNKIHLFEAEEEISKMFDSFKNEEDEDEFNIDDDIDIANNEEIMEG